MSDFTIDDTMARIRYEVDERKIYNDIRSEIGILISEEIVDADPTYKWRVWTRFPKIMSGTMQRITFTADYASPSNWQIASHSAKYLSSTDPYTTSPYYDYSIKLTTIDGNRRKAVEIKNTGSSTASFRIVVKYKYKATDEITHEETTPLTLTVRATDATSIREYGRRVMNLPWAEGTEESDMQSVVEHALKKYKDPVPRLRVTIKGITDALMTQIITREVSDLVTVVCTNLGLNADCFINAISITADPSGIPICKWELELQRAYELLTIFAIGISELGGDHVLG